MAHAPITIEEARRMLAAIGQQHVLTFFDRLPEAERAALLAQIASLPLASVPGWIDRYVSSTSSDAPTTTASDLQPVPYYPVDPGSLVRPWDAPAMRTVGESLLRAGKLCAFTVAGGQGTRLGFDGPKGAYPATPITRRPLFRIFAEQIIAAQRRYGITIPWYIMTSPLNHDATLAFFAEHGSFGLDPCNVMFFPQGVVPSFALDGKMLLATRSEVATNPDGHGGSLRALHTSGALADMRRRGIEHISYVQIDNPLAKVIDPVFIGLHAEAADSSAEMSSKMVAKAEPGERVGVFARAGGKLRVIEYSDLSPQQAAQREPDGRLRFNAGNIAAHMLGVAFVEKLNAGGGFSLPLHRAIKKVPHIDPATGAPVDPTHANAVKLEAFVFDALPMCGASIVLEVDRVEEFAPIKNAEGADSPATSAALQTERAARWLERAGIHIPRSPDGTPDCTIELSPLAATCAEDLRGRNVPEVTPGSSVLIGA